jgi:hypothetical protein
MEWWGTGSYPSIKGDVNCIFSFGKNDFLDCQNATKSSKRIKQMIRIIKNRPKMHFLNHFGGGQF